MAFLFLFFILLVNAAAFSLAENVSIRYVIIHSTSNASSSSSVSSSNVAVSTGATAAATPPAAQYATESLSNGGRGLSGSSGESADASDADPATVAPPVEGAMYYGGRGSYFSYDHQIPGLPGKDYPIYSEIPQTGFSCAHAQTGYFADENSGCQVIHICQEDGSLESFLCPNGTIFNQQYLVCDWWFNVDCSKSKDFYNLSVDNSHKSSPQLEIRDHEVSASVQDHTSVYPDPEESPSEEILDYTDDELDDSNSPEKRDTS